MSDFSHKAFGAFSLALAVSVWSLFTEIGRPVLPVIPIVVYTLYLYANRQAVGQLATDTLRDSPYFLGFLLTMCGLYKIFQDVSFNVALFGRNPQLMTQEVGAAVLTTIVGLFARQALHSLVPDQTAPEDDRIATLAAAVTSHAVAFEAARQQFFREMSAEQARRATELREAERQLLATVQRLVGPSGVRPTPAGASLAIAPAAPAAPTEPASNGSLERTPVDALPTQTAPEGAAPLPPPPLPTLVRAAPRAVYVAPAGAGRATPPRPHAVPAPYSVRSRPADARRPRRPAGPPRRP